MKKKMLLPTIIAVCTVLVAGAFIMLFREKPTIILELAIYRGDVLDGTHYYTLDDKGALRSYFGRRYGYRLGEGKFMRKTQESSRKFLSEEDMSNLRLMLVKLEESDVKIMQPSSGWIAELIYNDELYLSSTYFTHVYFSMVVEEIVRLSPMDIDVYR
jgi:hypothetical protein